MTQPDPSSLFTWNPAEYHKSSSAQQQWAQELITKLGLRGNERVLDIGCGDGKVTAEIARNLPGGNVTGLDSSPEMIRFARDHFSRSEYRNLLFVEADARALPFSEEFDVVFSNAALHWIPDHKPVLTGIARSLRSGGKLLIQMGGKGNAELALGAGDIVQKKTGMGEIFSWILLYLRLFRQHRIPLVADRIGIRTIAGRADPKGYDLCIPSGLCGLDPHHVASLDVKAAG